MVNIKKGDFIEIEYTGKTKEGIVFDTTNEQTAKDNKFYNENASYGPVIICVGQDHVIYGLDKRLAGKNLGEYDFELSPEEGFGKKSAKLLRLIPMSAFRKQSIHPIPGLQVNIDGIIGVVKAVSGGRIIVDFNHPLAGKELEYHIKVNRIVEDINEKTKSLVKLILNLKDDDLSVKNENNNIEIKILKKEAKIPEHIQKILKDKIIELVKVDKIDIEE